MMLLLAFGPVLLLWLLLAVIIGGPRDHNYVGRPPTAEEQLRRMARAYVRAYTKWINHALIPAVAKMNEAFKAAGVSMAQLAGALQTEEETDGPALVADPRD